VVVSKASAGVWYVITYPFTNKETISEKPLMESM